MGNSSVQLVTSSQPQRLATRCALLRKAERNHRGTIPGQAPCRTAWAQPKQQAQASSKGQLPASCKQQWDNAAAEEARRAKQGGNRQVRISTASRLPVLNTSSSSVWHRAREPLAARLLPCRPRNTAALRNKPQPLLTACVTSKSSAPRKAQPESAA